MAKTTNGTARSLTATRSIDRSAPAVAARGQRPAIRLAAVPNLADHSPGNSRRMLHRPRRIPAPSRRESVCLDLSLALEIRDSYARRQPDVNAGVWGIELDDCCCRSRHGLAP